MEELKNDFSFTECNLLINMVKFAEADNLTQASLARNIESKPTSPTFINLYKYLLDKGVITYRLTVGNSKLLTINAKKLTDLIDNQLVINKVFDYLQENHFAEW